MPAPSRAPRGRWYAEISRSGSSRTRRPQIIDREDLSPTILPTVKGLPRIEVPVPKDDDWLNYREASFSVWYDGVKQPIDEVEAVEQRPGATVLKGRGGLELLDRQQLEVQQDSASDVARDLLSGVSYAADVDDFNPMAAVGYGGSYGSSYGTAAAVETKTVQSADTTAEFQEVLPQPGATDPWEVASGELRPLQGCFFFDATADETAASGTVTISDSSYNAGNAEEFQNTGDEFSLEFTAPYDIPAGEVGLAIRYETDQYPNGAPQVYIYLDGSFICELNENVSAVLNWYTDGDDFPAFDPGGISEGDHTLRILDNSNISGAGIAIDTVAVYDTRYSWTFDNSVDANGYLSSPSLYPTQTIEFDDAEVVESVTGGTFTGTFSDTTGDQEIELTNDLTGGWQGATNQSTFDVDFGDLGPTLTARVTLGGGGSRTTAAPTEGYEPQALQSYTLEADVDDTPLIVEQGFDGQTQELLNQVAELADAVWEYRISDDGTETVTWTYPNQRPSTRDPDVSEWRYEETEEGAYDAVTVKGGSQNVEDERFDSNHGTAVPLAHDNIVVGSETVYDPGSDPLETFTRGADYELATIDGEITTLSGGEMSDTTEYAIDYSWRPAQTAENGASNPRETVVDIPSLATTRGCGQAALRILSGVDEPLKTGRLVVPASATDWRVTDSLTPSVFPGSDSVQLKDVEAVPGQVVLTVETRQSLADIVSDVRSQLQLVSQRG